MSKLSLIGAGNLGAAIAYEIASRELVDKIVLIDIMKDLAEGQAADIQQALPFRNKTKLYSAEYPALANSDIIIITAGKPRTPEMNDRLQLAEINFKIVGSIISEIKKYSPNSIIITITNPMDLINHFIHQQGFLREKVIGSGGQLDSSRLRIVLGHPEKDVDAYVLGEHGEDQVPILSRVKINGIQQSYSATEKENIRQKIKETALTVIQKKGATVFAPASNTADMVEAILKEQHKLMMCSANVQGEYGLTDVSMGVPVILGKNGIEKIEEWELEKEELQQLQEAGRKLKELYEKITLK
ncbi:MAG: malate dehydrogenase [Nanoarchaeota archaeon]|nr:malate dehydrogenase [Nanoarchaeota archaeon]